MLSHEPVLLNEVIEGLNVKPAGKYIDATFGRGGHSLQILKRLGSNGRLIAIDKDPAAVALAKQGPFLDKRFCIKQSSFAKLKDIVDEQGWCGAVNGILLDLGVSSPQLDDPSRGFSFTREGPLDMRMDPNTGISAARWLNSASVDDIAHVLRVYGEERFAKRIAKVIVEKREITPINTTLQLAHLVKDVLPKSKHDNHKHPATRTFQAIRIFINNELKDLEDCLVQSLNVMSVGGRICVISFHSLEDRIVKQFIQQEARGDEYPPDFPIKAVDLKPRLRRIGSLIRPSEMELHQNIRARSARLRITEKIS